MIQLPLKYRASKSKEKKNTCWSKTSSYTNHYYKDNRYAHSLVAGLTSPLAQSDWESKGKNVRIVRLTAYCNYLKIKNKSYEQYHIEQLIRYSNLFSRRLLTILCMDRCQFSYKTFDMIEHFWSHITMAVSLWQCWEDRYHIHHTI